MRRFIRVSRGAPEYEGESPRPKPTKSLPGTLSKIEELERRARLGLALFHEADGEADEETHRDLLSSVSTHNRSEAARKFQQERSHAQLAKDGNGGTV